MSNWTKEEIEYLNSGGGLGFRDFHAPGHTRAKAAGTPLAPSLPPELDLVPDYRQLAIKNGPTIYIKDGLMDEYIERLNTCDAHMKRFVIQEMEFKAAAPLLKMGYRDQEINLGEDFSTNPRAKFKWFARVPKPLPNAILRRRRMWRKIIPYKWWTQHWYKIFPFTRYKGTWRRVVPITWYH